MSGEAEQGKPTVFITLTSNPAWGESPEDRARLLVAAWQIVVRRAKQRGLVRQLQYFVVIERTKKGEPHLHILARITRLDQKWLSDQMKELNGAPIVWIERIRGKGHAAKYVSKYLGKDVASFNGCKRYWRSMDYLHPTRAEIKAMRDPNVVYFVSPDRFDLYKEALIAENGNVIREYPSLVECYIAPWNRAPPAAPASFRREASEE